MWNVSRPARFAAAATAVVALSCGALARAGAQGRGAPPPPAPRDAALAPGTAPAGSGVIAGTLVAIDTGKAVRQARVILAGGEPRVVKTATTDDQGAFSFDQLPAGPFTLTASRPGFLEATYGQRRPGNGRPGTPVQLAAGQKLDRLSLPIARGGVITGAVVDDAGDPAFGAQVRALRYVLRTGVRTLQVAGQGGTDDRGVYRIPALPPGEYLVVVSAREMGMVVEEMKMREELLSAAVARLAASGDTSPQMKEAALRDAMGSTAPPADGPMYAPVYYPGTTQPKSASTVTLDVSEERAGIDLRLQLAPAATVSGVVTSEGPLQPGTQVQLVDLDQPVPGMTSRSARVQPDGRFSFSAVLPGRYSVTARATLMTNEVAPQSAAAMAESLDKMRAMIAAGANIGDPRTTDTLWAATEIFVNGTSLQNVSLALQRGMSVSGSLTFDGAAPSADPSRLRVMLSPANDLASGGPPIPNREVAVDANGRFTIRGVLPGRYRLTTSGAVPGGLVVESATFAGRDALDFLLDVRPGEDQGGGIVNFTARLAELGGSLQDVAGKPVSDYTLVVFPSDMRYWLPQARRIQATRPATDGRFSFRNLPDGDYRLIAVVDPEPGQWFDPAFLRDLVQGSMPVTLGKGERRSQDIRATPAK